jgi:raffinose/stachyose/melibiose transport system permease protein
MPIVVVAINSFKSTTVITTSPFVLPNKNTFVGLRNYIEGITSGNYPFYKAIINSVIITVLSTGSILLCTSMCAWYIVRVNSKISKIFYYLCVVSMVVPFQMVMYTLPKTADELGLNNPIGIVIVYLGFGSGLAVFMFSGFVKSVPIAIEEAAYIDGCGPVRTFFSIVLQTMKPTFISVSILELMWIWNDYLLPYKVLDINKYRTIPIQIQYLNSGYGIRDMGAIMAMIIFSIVPIVIFYLFAQKYIIKGITAGAVKG